MLSHYHMVVDPKTENNAHSFVLAMVGSNKRVLEAGCASGHVSEILSARGCTVVGIEIDPLVAQTAEQWTERVVIGDLDHGILWDELAGETFDVILFGDVLEHLKDPLGTLRESIKHLRPEGTVVMSIPNIAHADIKIALINGRFPYSESGLLDSTHIHFFTKDTLLELIRDAGLVPIEITRVMASVFTTEVGVEKGCINDDVLEAVLGDRESETYQFVVKASRDDGTKSLQLLSEGLIAATDKLVDQVRGRTTVESMYSTLHSQHEELKVRHETDVRDLTYLRQRAEKVKRFLPGPVRHWIHKLISPPQQ